MEQLLKILENNARLPVEDIATMLNKSPAEVCLYGLTNPAGC